MQSWITIGASSEFFEDYVTREKKLSPELTKTVKFYHEKEDKNEVIRIELLSIELYGEVNGKIINYVFSPYWKKSSLAMGSYDLSGMYWAPGIPGGFRFSKPFYFALQKLQMRKSRKPVSYPEIMSSFLIDDLIFHP